MNAFHAFLSLKNCFVMNQHEEQTDVLNQVHTLLLKLLEEL